MLQLYNINKEYVTGDSVQNALNNLNLCLRDNEFVAILGPSGSGKTTMLNIIGGLDRYDSGDLIINGRSTKNYGDREWDSYRNHTIGFVFQSYNLIPHQSVLSNVELALTISGISKAKRKERAIKALEDVGLGAHIHKKPNQLSGGQMQRVAIARALVNNPDILLADEPTGALDSDTSIQVMELLKQVAKSRLVVMVTHNPELAQEYANRIVKLRDGKIVEDSNPYRISVSDFKKAKKGTTNKSSMSFRTALALSFNNLKSKFARTILTAFAGSIGIIGIAMILALSSGVNNYISDIQKQTMTAYPITLSAQAMDTSILEQQSSNPAAMREELMAELTTEYTEVYANYASLQASSMMETIIKENDLSAFKKYLDNPDSEINEYLGENGVVYSYNIKFDVFSKNSAGEYISSDANVRSLTGTSFGDTDFMFDTSMFESFFSSIVGATSSGAKNFSELLVGGNGDTVSKVTKESYELLYGSWPESYDEVVLVLDYKNSIPIEVLYQLGIINAEEYKSISDKISNGEQVTELNWDYASLCNRTFYLVAASDRYKPNGDGTFSYIEGKNEEEISSLLSKALNLKISGIIKPIFEAPNATIMTSVAYTSKLTDYLISYTDNSEIVLAQQSNPDTNVLTGAKFTPANDEEKIAQTKEYLADLNETERATMIAVIMMYMQEKNTDASQNTPDVDDDKSKGLLAGIFNMLNPDTSGTNAFSDMGNIFSLSGILSGKSLDKWLEESADDDTLLYIYDEYLSGYSYEENLISFGKASYDSPNAISIYTDSFDDKEAVARCIDNYNSTVEDDSKINYSDTIAMITDSITSIVDVVSYVLIAFVAVSLVVSSIMIGIITYISVLERTKEIGILRSIGASKQNISQVFNAETLIIGLISGLIGIIVTELSIIPINSIIHNLTSNTDVSADLSALSAIILILLSVTLTIVGGLIPSNKASKKDPVTALRSE